MLYSNVKRLSDIIKLWVLEKKMIDDIVSISCSEKPLSREEELCSKAYSEEELDDELDEEELDDMKVLVDMVGEEAAEGMIRAYLAKQGLVPSEEKTLPTFRGESVYTHSLWDIVNRLDQLSLEIKEIIERSL